VQVEQFLCNQERNQPIRVKVPWFEKLYNFVSWWDVEKFAASQYCVLTANLTTYVERYALNALAIVPFEDKSSLIEELQLMTDKCREIGLEVSALQFEAAIHGLQQRHLTAIQVSQMLVGLGQAIASEMSTHLFLWVPKEKSRYYEQVGLFGEKVTNSFPSAERDIKSAGSCYAENKNTACVMHLMRVLELGLASLAAKLNVTINNPNWHTVIADIETKIAQINGSHAGPNWKADRDFYAAAAKDFRYFKDAWRNHAMHVHEHYDELEARSILDHVKAFMVHLADNGLTG
jgi:hypothetical protein